MTESPAHLAANVHRDKYLQCSHCDGAGQFSDNGNDPWARVYDCRSCDGTGEKPGARQDWSDALTLWCMTPGDGDAKAEVLAERYDAELIEAIQAANQAYFQNSPELQALARALRVEEMDERSAA